MKRYLSTVSIIAIFVLLSSCSGKSQQPKQFEILFYEPDISFVSNEWLQFQSEKCNDNILGESDVYKYINTVGATVNEIIFAKKKENEKPNILTACLASGTWEKDINSDGIYEIIYTFGTPEPNIRIIFLKDGKILEADINKCTNSPSVRYIDDENVFIINYINDSTDYKYKLENETLIME